MKATDKLLRLLVLSSIRLFSFAMERSEATLPPHCPMGAPQCSVPQNCFAYCQKRGFEPANAYCLYGCCLCAN